MSKFEDSAKTRLVGKVIAFNVSRRGHVDGAILETTSGAVQVNFPARSAAALTSSMTVGSHVELGAIIREDESEDADHLVYVASARCDDDELTGKVVQINYSLNGLVNGFHLEDGVFVHLSPADARLCAARVGERVIATGTRQSHGPVPVLEARSVTRCKARPRRPSASVD